MATREEITIANSILAYLNNCQRDLRREAQFFLDEIANGHPRFNTAQLGVIVHQDGTNISGLLLRLQTFYGTVGAKQTKATNGLAFYGITLATANTDLIAGKAAADALVAADVSTDAAIIAAANACLAAIPAIDTID